MKILKVRQKF